MMAHIMVDADVGRLAVFGEWWGVGDGVWSRLSTCHGLWAMDTYLQIGYMEQSYKLMYAGHHMANTSWRMSANADA